MFLVANAHNCIGIVFILLVDKQLKYIVGVHRVFEGVHYIVVGFHLFHG
jgi:hypothetical protein